MKTMKRRIGLSVNGERYEIEVEPYTRLLDAIRDVIGLTGTKEGCGTGDCGACTVILNGKIVTSCMVLAASVNGSKITTVEGIRLNGGLHPIQKAFMEQGGLQCGICTPGMIVSSYALLRGNPNPTPDEIRFALAGNLCRCTGYDKIVKSVLSAAEMMRGTKL
jgi:carbon-monoxide dehydrogenase small subunit